MATWRTEYRTMLSDIPSGSGASTMQLPAPTAFVLADLQERIVASVTGGLGGAALSAFAGRSFDENALWVGIGTTGAIALGYILREYAAQVHADALDILRERGVDVPASGWTIKLVPVERRDDAGAATEPRTTEVEKHSGGVRITFYHPPNGAKLEDAQEVCKAICSSRFSTFSESKVKPRSVASAAFRLIQDDFDRRRWSIARGKAHEFTPCGKRRIYDLAGLPVMDGKYPAWINE